MLLIYNKTNIFNGVIIWRTEIRNKNKIYLLKVVKKRYKNLIKERALN